MTVCLGKQSSERTRKKTNANEITDEELIVVRRLAEVKDRLTIVHLKRESKSEIEDIVEDYVMKCEKAMQTGKREYQNICKRNGMKRNGKKKM